MRRLSFVAAVFAALLLGCISASLPKVAAPEMYALDPPLASRAFAREESSTPIVVASPRSAPGLAGRGMMYVQRAHEVRYFSRHAWVEPPARMLAPLLERALEAHGTFHAVRDAVIDQPAHLHLETDLLCLQQEFTDRPSRVRIVLQIRLLDSATRRVLGEREVEAVEVAPSEDPYGGVVAANAAASHALLEVESACAEWAHSPPAKAEGALSR